MGKKTVGTQKVSSRNEAARTWHSAPSTRRSGTQRPMLVSSVSAGGRGFGGVPELDTGRADGKEDSWDTESVVSERGRAHLALGTQHSALRHSATDARFFSLRRKPGVWGCPRITYRAGGWERRQLGHRKCRLVTRPRALGTRHPALGAQALSERCSFLHSPPEAGGLGVSPNYIPGGWERRQSGHRAVARGAPASRHSALYLDT